ncbi:membrane fusion protein, multidrug efflux system [Bryocella elongata]|uniref:Membrane fusion protein, multidrug efflux system n=1 Tax=Bryocella elongata TaxID=863522 RepID=A0A1H5VUF9_9BACT|nr:HlyD family secretion protein [Bryocella elongata]SEF90491.1 membrane fusion protein, multidrug efflux system [Bryocella elongata]
MLKRSIIIPVLIAGAAAALLVALGSQWSPFTGTASLPETDDAYIRADQTPLSTRVSGTVRQVYMGDYQTVTKGQLILELEDNDYKAALAETQSALAAANAEYAANQDAKRAADAAVASARSAIAGARDASTAASAGITAVQAEVTHAGSEFQRQQNLLVGKAATQQQYEAALAARDHAAAQLQVQQAEFSRSSTMVATAQSSLAAAEQQRASLNARDAALLAQIEARKAAITIAEVNLGYTKFYAPASGGLGEFHVHPGQLVSPGMPVVELVQSGVWIQANYRETQLGHVRPGDNVDITVDAIAEHTFHGHVAEIAPASGSQFALLPPDNATGNYTKIVQRVPVRIELTPDDQTARLRPGFSAVVKIHTSSDNHGSSSPRESR